MMERALKERIIGAMVLVVFVVLVVPIFLDGPPDEAPIVSEQVLLPGQEAQDTKVVVLDRERSVPIPAVSTSPDRPLQTADEPADKPIVKSEPAPKPIVVDSSPSSTSPSSKSPSSKSPSSKSPRVAEPTTNETSTEPESKAGREVSTPVSSATGMWAVQLGSFSNKENAEALAASLREQGYAAFLSRTLSAGKELHRVRIGPQKDRDSAEQMATRLAKVGHRGQVLPHP